MEKQIFYKNLIASMKQNANIDLNLEAAEKFYIFMQNVLEKNKVMNLTAITNEFDFITKHFVDSCMILKYINEKLFKNKKIIDVGTGAGFPGIPLAILCPDTKFILVDSLAKRINFLKKTTSILHLTNVNLVHARIEDLGHDNNFREKFDFSLTRGVAKISILMEYLLPLTKINNYAMLYKMDDCEKELNDANFAIKKLGGKFIEKWSYDIYDNSKNEIIKEPARCYLKIEKIKPCDKQYPRKAGTPSKSPLIN